MTEIRISEFGDLPRIVDELDDISLAALTPATEAIAELISLLRSRGVPINDVTVLLEGMVIAPAWIVASVKS